MLWRMLSTGLVAPALLWWASGVLAQTSDATCLPFYQWTFNSHKKSPCEVASSLIAVCAGTFNVDPLPDGHHYSGPASLSEASPCLCNTVTYSLMSACGACQGKTYLSWSTWSGSCPMVTVGSFPKPIPNSTFVPGWAYLDVESNDDFDQTLARQNANLTESAVIPSPTSISATSTSQTSKLPRSTSHKLSSAATTAHVSTTSAAASTTSSASSDAQSAAVNERRANAISGGVTGGLVGFIGLGGLLYWLIHRRHRDSNRQQLRSPAESTFREPEPSMRQYIANTVPNHLASSNNTLASRAMFTDNSPNGSAHSVGPTNV